MAHKVVLRPAAVADLIAIYDWIADRSDDDTATSYCDRLLAACARLADFPDRGSKRDDLLPGARTLAFERRAVIVYQVGIVEVRIIRVLHRGRDLGGALQVPEDN